MVNGKSEIDDADFFFSSRGNKDAKDELHATLNAFFNEIKFDDDSSLCKFPARKAWLEKKLDITQFPHANCQEYDKILTRLDPKSATLVFPSAHINSPASMFGHTFLRINSAYDSKLLSYAVNYAADADPNKENGFLFAIKGLFGGYFGTYSLLPYYDKLKEYRDTESRDVFEYDLNLSEDEVLKMVMHIWELNGTRSYYYFFTENCSYNMLWLLEVARESLHLKEYFYYQVTPMETVHIINQEGIISQRHYRASKRSKLLEYEKLIDKAYIHMPLEIINSPVNIKKIVQDKQIQLTQKQYILEASIELLEYNFKRNQMSKDEFLTKFHLLSKTRASLGAGETISIKEPPNPLESHRAMRLSFAYGEKDAKATTYIGIRPTYHDLTDSNYGFLRGTQIEFLNLLIANSQDETYIDTATILSITSLTQNSEFIQGFSWRTKLGWNQNYLDDNTSFNATVGVGFSYGNQLGFSYFLIDPLLYLKDTFVSGVDFSAGFIIDTYKFASTNIEVKKRFYDDGKNQWLINATQSFRTSQNTQIGFNYNYQNKFNLATKYTTKSYRGYFNYYF